MAPTSLSKVGAINPTFIGGCLKVALHHRSSVDQSTMVPRLMAREIAKTKSRCEVLATPPGVAAADWHMPKLADVFPALESGIPGRVRLK